jgi:hypothetical protein
LSPPVADILVSPAISSIKKRKKEQKDITMGTNKQKENNLMFANLEFD